MAHAPSSREDGGVDEELGARLQAHESSFGVAHEHIFVLQFPTHVPWKQKNWKPERTVWRSPWLLPSQNLGNTET